MSFSMSIEWMRVQGRALCMNFWSILINTICKGQTLYRLLVVIPLNDTIVLRIESLCLHPNIETKVVLVQSTIFDNWENKLSKISNVSPSVLPNISKRVTMYILSFVVDLRHFSSRHATVCDCHWKYLRGGVPPGRGVERQFFGA